jgi:hypothetical protein
LNELSSEAFQGLKMKLKEIVLTEVGNVAEIELIENQNIVSWRGYYLQGTTGADNTMDILEKTLLLNKFPIIGFRLHYDYDGFTISDFEHLGSKVNNNEIITLSQPSAHN